MKLPSSSSIMRVNEASVKECEMLRQAIRGEFEGGKYLRDIGTGAAAGAAGGAIAGGGVGSLPGAAVGAIGGAAWGLGSNAAADIAYQLYGAEGKAAWQAGDIQENLSKLGGMLKGKLKSPQIGDLLNGLGVQYKNYIDVAVNKNDNKDEKDIYEQNIFNPSSESHKNFKNTLPQQQPQVTASKSAKFVRLAYEDSPAGMAGGLGSAVVGDKLLFKYLKNPASVSPQDAALIKSQIQTNPNVQHMVEQIKNMVAQGKGWSAPDPIPSAWSQQWNSQNVNKVVPKNEAEYLQMYEDYYKPNNMVDDVVTNTADDALANTIKSTEQIAAQSVGKTKLNPASVLNATWKGVKGLGVGFLISLQNYDEKTKQGDGRKAASKKGVAAQLKDIKKALSDRGFDDKELSENLQRRF